MTRNKKYNYKDDLKVMLDYGEKKIERVRVVIVFKR